MEKLELNDLKKIELSIMDKIHTFCLLNGLRYYLAYGTLLGAIRHDGFIPWDDDIDLFMFRDDYDTFERKFDAWDGRGNCKIFSMHSNPKFYRPFLDVCDTSTTLRENWTKNGFDERGVFVDIWPLDGASKFRFPRRVHRLRTKFAQMELYASISNSNCLKKHRFFVKGCYSLLSNTNPDKNVRKWDALCRKYPCSSSNAVTCLTAGIQEFDKAWFGEPIKHKFENREFFIPTNFDCILRATYGDYLILPPEKDRVPHHQFVAFKK